MAPARSSAYAAAGPRRTGRDSRARTAAKRQACLAHCSDSRRRKSLRFPSAARAEAPRHSALAPCCADAARKATCTARVARVVARHRSCPRAGTGASERDGN
jgi:hypothetical protein